MTENRERGTGDLSTTDMSGLTKKDYKNMTSKRSTTHALIIS